MDRNQIILDEIKDIIKETHILCSEPMRKHTTFQIGGPAQIMVFPETKEEIRAIILFCTKKEVPLLVIGNGSNLLVSDQGIDGVVMVLGQNFASCECNGTMVKARAGALLSFIGNQACKESLSGFEFAAGIPGTLGGAIRMNAGAYGGEMKDIVESVDVIDEEGNERTLSAAEMQFGYRYSVIEEMGYIVLGATMKLQPGNESEIRTKMKELAEARRSKQPLEYPSAGSTFKRPEGYFAGKLIMDAGLRGYRVGGAQVSEKHCGFVVNCGGATAKDVLTLMDDVKKRVFDAYQVTLEPEVRVVGKCM